MEPEPFWMIHCAGTSTPTFRHASFDSARREAKRLARANPGQEFVVLESVAAALKHDVAFRFIRRRDQPGPVTDFDSSNAYDAEFPG